MDALKVAAAVQSGLSVVCATCERYWEGREAGLEGSLCTSPGPCGSPLVRLTFPYYRGPITDFSRWCFVCGAGATHGIKVESLERVVGVCRQHITFLKDLRATDMRRINGLELLDILSSKGRENAKDFFGSPRKSLLRAIAETEAEFEGSARRK